MSQSWFRKDNVEVDDDKAPDWRRDRGRDRDWDRDRNAKLEAEPEWMDSAEPEEPFQARTQEDFQRWKERMKAGGAAPLETDVASPIVEDKQAAKRVASVEPDDSMDKFFAKFESKATEQKAPTIKAAGKSKFASLFSPATEQRQQVEFGFPQTQIPSTERPSSAQAAASANDADQAGFARILEMLQTRSNNPTPQSHETGNPRMSLYARGTEPLDLPEVKGQTDELLAHLTGGRFQTRAQLHEQSYARAPEQTSGSDPRNHPDSFIRFMGGPDARAQPQPSEQTMQPPRSHDFDSPIEQHTHTRQQSSINKDEVLLNLLRQASLAPKPQPQPPAGIGMFGVSPESGRPMNPRATMISPTQGEPGEFRGGARGSLLDESPISMYLNEQGQREQGARRPTNGSQQIYSDDPLMAMMRGQQRPVQQHVPQGYPPGLQRPPGLDQMQRPNPGWTAPQPQPQPQQQQAPRQPNLPPGLANLHRGMSGAPYGQPQQIPTQQAQQQQQQQQRPQPQRKYTSESSMPPNLPPGMYPPPGFMNAGPPPGFPGSMVNHPAARFGGDPGPSRQHFMETYGEVMGIGRGVGLRGGAGNGGMPPYR